MRCHSERSEESRLLRWHFARHPRFFAALRMTIPTIVRCLILLFWTLSQNDKSILDPRFAASFPAFSYFMDSGYDLVAEGGEGVGVIDVGQAEVKVVEAEGCQVS